MRSRATELTINNERHAKISGDTQQRGHGTECQQVQQHQVRFSERPQPAQKLCFEAKFWEYLSLWCWAG